MNAFELCMRRYKTSHKEISFQRRNIQTQSSDFKRKAPINKMIRAHAHKYIVVHNLPWNTSVQLKLFFPVALTSQHSRGRSEHNLVKDQRKETDSISGEIG